MEYLLYSLAGLASLIVIVVLIAAMRPSDFRIFRSETIRAGAGALFPYIDNLRKFQEWSPYKDRDPAAKNDFDGPEAGPGAEFRWNGNSQVGQGIMKITQHTRDVNVTVDLQFIKPFPGHNTVVFSLAPNGEQTTVSWTMTGRFALMPKIVGLFINMDRMIGNDFAHGLARLKALTETGSVANAAKGV